MPPSTASTRHGVALSLVAGLASAPTLVELNNPIKYIPLKYAKITVIITMKI
tara:strand:- start:720 stop:875 length:156 start_codon:yes stop_codon:yes gene_type:complete